MLSVNHFGEIPCSVCGFNEGAPSPNMKHICSDCREWMREQTLAQYPVTAQVKEKTDDK